MSGTACQLSQKYCYHTHDCTLLATVLSVKPLVHSLIRPLLAFKVIIISLHPHSYLPKVYLVMCFKRSWLQVSKPTRLHMCLLHPGPLERGGHNSNIFPSYEKIRNSSACNCLRSSDTLYFFHSHTLQKLRLMK
jgi:hypothetical protein